MECAMNEPESGNWFAIVLAPIVLLLVALPLYGLQQATQRLEPSDRDTPRWRSELDRVDRALADHDVSAAVRSWQEAYPAALGSRTWEAMVEVGQAYVRIGDAASARRAAEPKARQAYLIALFRARQAGALDGVLHTAEAFAALGDEGMVDQSIRIAERLARNDEGRDRVRRFAARFSD